MSRINYEALAERGITFPPAFFESPARIQQCVLTTLLRNPRIGRIIRETAIPPNALNSDSPVPKANAPETATCANALAPSAAAKIEESAQSSHTAANTSKVDGKKKPLTDKKTKKGEGKGKGKKRPADVENVEPELHDNDDDDLTSMKFNDDVQLQSFEIDDQPNQKETKTCKSKPNPKMSLMRQTIANMLNIEEHISKKYLTPSNRAEAVGEPTPKKRKLLSQSMVDCCSED